MEESRLAARPSKRVGDKGPGPDEPPSRRGIDGVKLLLDFLGRRRPSTAGDLVLRRRTPLAELPPMDFEPMQFQAPPSPLERTDREKLIKAMEKSIADEFRRRLSRGEAPAAGVDVKNLFSPSPLPTIRLETKPPPREETFTEKLMRHLQTPPPREETFSEKLERYMQEPPDFRTEGERQRDAK